MAALSSLFLVIALVLAVLIGPQTRPWPWGPAMLALGIAVIAALPELWKKKKSSADLGLLIFASIVVSWFAWRAWFSPVMQLGETDLMLLAGAAGAFISIRAIEGNALAEKILGWGIALLLLANVIVIGKQMIDPSYSPIFKSRAAIFPSGFYAHYNEAANYLIASSLVVAALALFGRHGSATRVVWGLIAISGLAAVYYTRSRGGLLGAAIGGGVLACGALVIGKRINSRWFAPTLIAIPLIAAVLGVFLFSGWQESQKTRNIKDGVDQLLDNNIRLHLLGAAASTIELHPWLGGGSRSFSWESYQFLDTNRHGSAVTRRPEQVHNELVQATTDYGIIGVVLLIGLFGTLIITSFIRLIFEENPSILDSVDAWRIGGLAAFAGMFVQSCFSFVFHLLPGVILLGICLSKMSRSKSDHAKTYQVIGSKIFLTFAAIATIFILLPHGWKGSKVTEVLWKTHFSKSEDIPNDHAIDALTKAISIWPHFSFYEERAAIAQAAADSGDDVASKESTAMAIRDYTKAQHLHPYDPGIAINLANLLSRELQDTDAEYFYNQATQLQGGMELAFQAHLFFGHHLIAKAARQFDINEPSISLSSLEIAAQQIETAVKKVQTHSHRVNVLRLMIHENLGIAHEANGNYNKALKAYDFTASLPSGSSAHYRAGLLLIKMATKEWNARRPSEAMSYFNDAKKRIQLAATLPKAVTATQRAETIAYIDNSIRFLEGAKIRPKENLPIR